MQRAIELAWDSFRAGSLGIGAVVTRHGEVVATGRNRMVETDPGDDVLAGTSLAHAEMNALAKLRWPSPPDGLELWTTLQPCVQCAGAIRLSPVRKVHVLAPDPLFRGLEQMRHVNEFIGRDWPETVERPIDEWAVLSLLLLTHVTIFWGVDLPGWNEALPSVAALAGDLIATGDLITHATDPAATATTVATALRPRLTACLPDLERLSTSV